MRYIFLFINYYNAYATESNSEPLTCFAKHSDTDEEVEVKIPLQLVLKKSQ